MSKSSGFTHESPLNQSAEWYTPPEIFEALGLKFALDPCSPGVGRSFVPAARHLTISDDGLSLPWQGTVFCNPPYGSATKSWLAKLAYHGDGVALVFARTDTKWFQATAERADAICFIGSRVRFYAGSTATRGGSPGAGSALFAFGETATQAVLESGLGFCVASAAQRRAA